MEEKATSLREWAKENKVWEPKTWRTFLKEDLVPFYKQAYTLNELYKLLKGEKICGRTSLADIEDETLKNKIRVAIYGGIGLNKNISTPFANFMYDNFGLCAENATSFEESIKHYESWEDEIKLNVNPNSWINSIPIEGLVDELKNLISILRYELQINLVEVGIQEYSFAPLEFIKPEDLLPLPGEKPEKLIELIYKFKQNALNLSIGVNPFTTFVFYSRAIPMRALMEFLEYDEEKVASLAVASLAKFLGLQGYSMIDLREVSLSTKSPDKVILLLTDNSVSHKVLRLQSFLLKIDSEVGRTYERMTEQAINQVHITFEPWKDYEPIFSFISNALKDGGDRIDLEVENGKVVKMRKVFYGGEIELPNKIWLRDFLVKISPFISAGIVSLYYPSGTLYFNPLAKKWINKVIENGGKT